MASNIEILNAVTAMRNEFGERLGLLETSSALANQSLNLLTSKVDKIDQVVITGNGESPLREIVKDTKNRLDGHLKDMKDCEKEKKDNKVWFNRLVIGAIVAQSIGLLFLIMRGGII